MQKSNPIISILIVHYRIQKELFDCIRSIYKSELKIPFEIIIVDHDESPTIEKQLKTYFPKAKYYKSDNKGWGAGINTASSYAKGEYLYFLNPDTILYPKAINFLYEFFKKHKDAAVVSSLLLHPNRKPHELQGSADLTPLKAIVVYSFLDKLLPRNPIVKKFWTQGWKKNKAKRVEIAPLSTALIKKSIFINAGKFDERFFLYFEEYDLGRRIRAMGFQNYIIPDSKVIHLWGQSTKKITGINEIFIHSRFLYFKKYFGIIPALLTESFLRINKTFILLVLILGLGTFLRLYQINYLMPFIGDQGWFYLSARDIIINGKIPLVGITSSHPWLHQGALWTYLLAFCFQLLGFNPVNGAYLSITIDILVIFAIYKVSSKMFSKRFGLIAAGLYATSPLVIINARMPYHTSPIPLFSVIFIYFLYKLIKGNKYYFPLTITTLAILYNLEISNFIFSAVFMLLLAYGVIKKRAWTMEIFDSKFLTLSIIAFLIPMLPMIIYDLNHGFPQTLGLIAWIGYKLLNSVGILSIHNSSTSQNWIDLFSFLSTRISRLFFMQNEIFSLLIYFSTLTYGAIAIKKQKLESNVGIIVIINFSILLGLLIIKTPSDAYLPILFAPAIILFSYLINNLLNIKIIFKLVVFSFLVLIAINSYSLVKNNYFIGNKNGYGPSLSKRFEAAKKIISLVKNQPYNLVGNGKGSKFKSYTMNYEYITWYLGNPLKKEKQKIIISVSENYDSVFIH